MDYFNLISYDRFLNIISNINITKLNSVNINLDSAYNRYCYEDIYASENLPGFRRSQVDGFAVKSEDTFSASSSPVYLKIKGKLAVDEDASIHTVKNGECFKISTGGMVPEGADAVVMLEYTSELTEDTVEILRPVAPGENVIKEDEDIKKGDLIIKSGTLLKAHHLGILASLGIKNIRVFEELRIGIISTGNELVDFTKKSRPGKIREVNSHTLMALCKKEQAIPRYYGISKDDEKEIKNLLEKSLEQNHITIISGGSSVGTRDLTLKVIDNIPGSKILFHGIAIKPGKPTIMAAIGDRFIFGLPGQVMSSIVSFLLVIKPLIVKIYQHKINADLKYLFEYSFRYSMVTSGSNIKSTLGRLEWVNCRVEKKGNQTLAYPVYSKSGVLGSMLKSDGFAIIDENREGVKKGETIRFLYFDSIL